ncbi:dTDP-4-dehydrorhamnose reductase [Catalinimonas alkaloidigena]|uniref:dTDP-4-dehydrorhamnose reductase n=1 Tax=Catalinimonas alkaloidigena TaxID=1075417 RepID=UPI002404C7EA|nr:dTDP-4-dehydrorhamnose reductase [Catalinimonas alkaloidigena]MDF9796226.1 dTDP-4-dehydrorhamnose reductase [Catalinimonas alkaloidigena]
MKILITGANGLLGQKLIALLSHEHNIEVVATSRGENVNYYDLPEYHFCSLDITDREQVMQVIGDEKPDVIVHTAAMTNVDACEQNQGDCWKVNVLAVEWLLEAAKEIDAFFIHLSTDFVFSGSNGPLAEDAAIGPVNYYGKSKAEAELLVQQSEVDHAIVRTALVYGVAPSMSRSNIVLWVKESLENGKSIKVVDDQFRTPTLAEDLAQACWLIAQKRSRGIFHISDEEVFTPYELSLLVAEHFNLDKSLISRTDSGEFTQPAKRPPKTGFIIEKAKNELGYQPHTFKEGLAYLEKHLKKTEKITAS